MKIKLDENLPHRCAIQAGPTSSLGVLELFREETADDWVGCFVVVTERKIRMLKPEGEGKT